MPKAFKDAIKKGARVRTKKLPDGKYIHIAYLDGESLAGEVKKKKTNPPGTTRKK
jgi:hypothetical protein